MTILFQFGTIWNIILSFNMSNFFQLVIQHPLQIGQNTVKESESRKSKTEYQPFFIDSLEESQAIELLQSIRDTNNDEDSITRATNILSKALLKKTKILGEYIPEQQSICFYQGYELCPEVVKIHERFHAIHHLMPDPATGSIWENYPYVSSFYKELLAQLFTFNYSRSNTRLLAQFEKLNEEQSFLYRSWKIYRHLNSLEIEQLYWKIRNALTNATEVDPYQSIDNIFKPSEIDNSVFDGIRKTVNRFRERPFNYFTEADLHSSLANDIMKGSSDILTYRPDKLKEISVSLVHQEYPTNFRYEKDKLFEGYSEGAFELTHITSKYGDRGNFDLAVLNPEFLRTMFESCSDNNYLLVLKNIINKDIKLALCRDSDLIKKELLYAIEVKFLHEFNASSKSMINEVIKDNEKLRLAYCHSNRNLRVINLVFCSSDGKNSNVVDDIKESIQNSVPDGMLNIFIESYLSDRKRTIKPIVNNNFPFWSIPLIKALGLK